MRWLVITLALTGCVRAELVICDDGRACPAGTACDLVHATCVDPAQFEVCESAATGALCEAAGVIGMCDRGVCLAPMIVPFGDPAPLLGINSEDTEEDDPSLTGDLLEIFFLRNEKLWTSLRPTTTAVWPPPHVITELDGPEIELRPSVSADGKTLYFTRRPTGQQGDIYVSIRAARGQPWSIPSRVDIDLARPDKEELCGWSSADGTSLLVTATSTRGDRDVYLATRSGNAFTTVPLTGINTTDNDGAAWATADGNQLMFDSDRYGTIDIWEAVKRGDTWDVAHHPELSTGRSDGTPWLSPDGAVVVYSQTTGGTDDLFIATRLPQR